MISERRRDRLFLRDTLRIVDTSGKEQARFQFPNQIPYEWVWYADSSIIINFNSDWSSTVRVEQLLEFNPLSKSVRELRSCRLEQGLSPNRGNGKIDPSLSPVLKLVPQTPEYRGPFVSVDGTPYLEHDPQDEFGEKRLVPIFESGREVPDDTAKRILTFADDGIYLRDTAGTDSVRVSTSTARPVHELLYPLAKYRHGVIAFDGSLLIADTDSLITVLDCFTTPPPRGLTYECLLEDQNPVIPEALSVRLTTDGHRTFSSAPFVFDIRSGQCQILFEEMEVPDEIQCQYAPNGIDIVCRRGNELLVIGRERL